MIRYAERSRHVHLAFLDGRSAGNGILRGSCRKNLCCIRLSNDKCTQYAYQDSYFLHKPQRRSPTFLARPMNIDLDLSMSDRRYDR